MYKAVLAICLLVSFVFGDGEVPCNIPGPRNLSHSVAIVGAGAAGVHMALKLKEKGFQNVVVYEQGSTVSGDDYLTSWRGTTFAFPARVSRFNIIMKALMDKYAADSLIKLPPSNKWSSVKLSNSNLEALSRRQYVMERGKKILNNQNETAVKIIMMNTLYNYINIYNGIFSFGSPCFFQKEPAWGKGKFDTVGSFRTFLNRFNLQLLDPLFEESTLEGKGYLDEIPATYGLFMFTPAIINHLVQFVNNTQSAEFVDYAIKNGERQLWQSIVSRENLNVQFNSRVDRLRRDSLTENTNVHLRVNGQWRTFQFVIWTPNLQRAIKEIWSWKRPEFNAGPSHEEYQNFLRIDQDVNLMYRSVYLFDSELLGRGGSYIDEYPDDVQKKNGIYQMYDNYAMYNDQTNANLYKNKLYQQENADGSEFRTVMAVNYFTQSSGVGNNIYGDFQKVQDMFTPVNVSYVAQSTRQLFPRYSNSDALNGMLWRVLAMQGKAGIWYTGNSVYVDDVKMVLQYNEILLNKMKAPVSGGGGSNTIN